jgi:phosphatidylserine decarboxylase
MSKGWGWLAERPVPETMRPAVYGLYSSAFGVNLEEALDADLKYVEFSFALTIALPHLDP